MDQVVVMQNLFHGRTIGHVFDLKGSSRSRYVTVVPPTVTASTVSATPGEDGAATASADAVSLCIYSRKHCCCIMSAVTLRDCTFVRFQSMQCSCDAVSWPSVADWCTAAI
jgi:hypothetical protein